jgi:hypothetical protein
VCRIPKVLIVAPEERHLDLRRALGSLEYDIAATVVAGAQGGITADVALVFEPDEALVDLLRARGLKVATFGSAAATGDLDLGEDVGTFKERIWELLRPAV